TTLSLALTTPSPTRHAAGLALASRHTWSAAARRHLAFYRTL
ncbi:MAG: hypothetical protein QOF98_881, partial [Streptomyces sp.]|nr:hypothetical protein [Streptomyces sp.]